MPFPAKTQAVRMDDQSGQEHVCLGFSRQDQDKMFFLSYGLPGGIGSVKITRTFRGYCQLPHTRPAAGKTLPYLNRGVRIYS